MREDRRTPWRPDRWRTRRGAVVDGGRRGNDVVNVSLLLTHRPVPIPSLAFKLQSSSPSTSWTQPGAVLPGGTNLERGHRPVLFQLPSPYQVQLFGNCLNFC